MQYQHLHNWFYTTINSCNWLIAARASSYVVLTSFIYVRAIIFWKSGIGCTLHTHLWWNKGAILVPSSPQGASVLMELMGPLSLGSDQADGNIGLTLAGSDVTMHFDLLTS